MLSIGVVLRDDNFENAIRKRIDNMHADFAYYAKYNTGPEYGSQWHFVNPLNKIWDLRINLMHEYVDKKIDERHKMELRRLMS